MRKVVVMGELRTVAVDGHLLERARRWAASFHRALLDRLSRSYRRVRFRGSQRYWETRYASGGDSGAGSKGRLAEMKGGFLNQFVRENGIATVLELGCGDGHQLKLAEYPAYVGYDVSTNALTRCREMFAGDATKRFEIYDASLGLKDRAELALSLDVIYHLVEDHVFESYMRDLFHGAERFVVVYSSDSDSPVREPHVRHRRFTKWVDDNIEGWYLSDVVSNPMPYEGDDNRGSFAQFFVFRPMRTRPGGK